MLGQPDAHICASVFFALLMVYSSCAPYDAGPKQRPNRVPKDAVWAGGPDGGSYILCDMDHEHDVNHCSVWNDFTGDLMEHGSYRLLHEKRAARADELRFLWADRGGRIGPRNQKVLADTNGRHPR